MLLQDKKIIPNHLCAIIFFQGYIIFYRTRSQIWRASVYAKHSLSYRLDSIHRWNTCFFIGCFFSFLYTSKYSGVASKKIFWNFFPWICVRCLTQQASVLNISWIVSQRSTETKMCSNFHPGNALSCNKTVRRSVGLCRNERNTGLL